VEPDTRDAIVDFIHHWHDRAEMTLKQMVMWIGLGYSKYSHWKQRYGKANEHNHLVPRDHWLEEWEKKAIVEFGRAHPLEGYRRSAFMMMDEDVVAASPATVYRVMKEAGLLRRWNGRRSTKGTGFEQPIAAHEHWHIDVSYINICGTFYYLCSLLDGYSRYIVHWELREQMKVSDVEVIIERAREKFPQARPRIISDNGPQFIARDFKEYIRISGMSHVRTSPYYPQSNGKIERWHKTLKSSCIRTRTPLTPEDARRVVAEFVEHYNAVRLHSSIGYVSPKDKLEGRAAQIHTERDRKLEQAREARRVRRAALRSPCEDRIDPSLPWWAGLQGQE
jgi:putative transposase